VKVHFNNQIESKQVNFKGVSPVKSDTGFKEYEFSYPFDDKVFDCYLELFPVSTDENGNYIVDEESLANEKNGEKFIKLTTGSNKLNLARNYQISNNEPFAYHYKLVPVGKPATTESKDGATYAIDAGIAVAQKEKYNIYAPSSNCSHGGSMKLLTPDTYNAGFTYDKDGAIVPRRNLDKLFKSVRTFSNKIGGTLAGIEEDINKGKFDGYTRIVSTPLFTDDSLTGHGYWNKNDFQIAQSLGNIDNYRSLQKAMFAKGLNLVSDGAFVNEGLEGIHLKHVLKWGNKSPFFNWFRIAGLKDSPLTLGVFAKNKEFIGHRIVNPKYEYTQNADGTISRSRVLSSYNAKKPTYIQIYDTRLVDADKLDSQKLIKSYDKINTDNPLEINNHNDTVIPYSYEINPDTYDNNIQQLNQHNEMVSSKEDKIFINTPQGARFLTKFENFDLEDKFECGFETWDANADIAKLNYVFSNKDTEALCNIPYEQLPEIIEDMKHKNFEVQDYAIKSGEYWTKKTSQILNLHVAQNLKNLEQANPKKAYDEIHNKIQSGVFPKQLEKVLSQDIVKNVFNGSYQLKNNKRNDKYENIVLRGLMDVPLDSIELGDTIAAVFASPYINSLASDKDFLGMSRYDLYKRENPHVQPQDLKLYNKMNSVYEKEMAEFAQKVLDKLDKAQPDNAKIISGPNATEYGKFVLPILTAEIAKYAVIKGLFPDAKVKVNDNGDISYDYEALKQTSLNELGIIASSPKDEAKCLVNELKSGISRLNKNTRIQEKLAEALAKSLKGTDRNSFALAEMIVDRTETGLDWRIDATKDIGDMEAVRQANTDFEYTWNQVINFWKHFTDGVIKWNPNAYLTAEITDEGDLHKAGEGASSERFKHINNDNKYDSDIVSKFLRETRINATANYNTFFSTLPEIFAQNFETGDTSQNHGNYIDKLLFEKLIGRDNYVQSGPLQSLIYSYTFIGNHDKPRALHCMALDMHMFYNLEGHEEQAYRMLRNNLDGNIDNKDFENFKKYELSAVSSKNLAMSYALYDGFKDVLNKMKNDNQINDENYDKISKAVTQAISDLSNGIFEGENFETDAFGFKPFDITIDVVLRQAKNNGLRLNEDDIKTLSNKVFQQILEPANKKLLAMMKILVALPGNPTLYAGDDLNSTGADYKSKNVTTDNRSYLHHEWTDKDDYKNYKKFVKDYEEKFAEVMKTRSKDELRALNTGSPFTLAMQNGYKKDGSYQPVTAILHHATDGSMALSLFNLSGTVRHHKADYNPEKLYIPSIDLYQPQGSNTIGLPRGLRAAQQDDNGNFNGDGLIFKNAGKVWREVEVKNPDGSTKTEWQFVDDPKLYRVCRSKDELYFIKCYDRDKNGNLYAKDIEMDDTTMNLYYDPKNPISFTGKAMPRRRYLYNPQYHFGNPYANLSKQYVLGEKLAITAK